MRVNAFGPSIAIGFAMPVGSAVGITAVHPVRTCLTLQKNELTQKKNKRWVLELELTLINIWKPQHPFSDYLPSPTFQDHSLKVQLMQHM